MQPVSTYLRHTCSARSTHPAGAVGRNPVDSTFETVIFLPHTELYSVTLSTGRVPLRDLVGVRRHRARSHKTIADE